MRAGFAAGTFLSLGLWASTASGAGNDFRLNGTDLDGGGLLFSCDPRPCAPDDQAFREFTSELAFVLSPRLASPAATLGVAGFQVAVLWSGNIVSGNDYWQITESGQDSGEPSSFLQTLQLEVRKGLPYSFEIAATLNWLTDSQIFAPGAELRWSFQEGYDFLPDFGLRAAVSTMVGNSDLNLSMVSADLVISRTFAVGGVAQLTPYMSLGALFISASTEVVDPTPTSLVSDGGPLRPDVENDIAFASIGLADEVSGKALLGFQSRFSMVDILVQGELQVLRDGDVLGDAGTISVKVGLTY